MTDEYDLNLIRRIVDGDHQAFRHLAAKYKDRSMSLAQSILKDHALAEDALQESFIKVYKNLNRFTPDAKFSTWLFRIVVNTCYRTYNQQKNRIKQENSYAQFSKTTESNIQLYDFKQKHYINRVMDSLKPDEALILRLFYLEELPHKEIQAITGFSKSKIKVDLYRGRIQFYENMQKLYGNFQKAQL